MKQIYRQFEGRGRDSLLHRNLRMCTEEGAFATPFIVITVPGNLFIAALLTTVLGIDKSVYGWIVSLPALANALQILLVPLLAQRFSARALALGFGLINLVIWLALIATMRLLPMEDPNQAGRLMILYFAGISVTQSLSGVSWISWVQEWIPERLRGKYFGSRNRLISLITVVFILSTGAVFDRFGESLPAFEIILGVTCVFRLLSLYTMTHIYTPWSQPEQMVHEAGRSRFGELLTPGPFRVYLVFAAFLAFGLALTGPFAPVFMTEHLGFSVSHQIHLVVVANIASAILFPVWGRLCDRYGCRPVIILTGLGWMLQNYLWVILTPKLTWLLYPMWLVGGAMSGGVILGGFNLVLKLTPTHLRQTGVSLHLAATSLAAAFAPILSGWFVSSTLLPLAEGAFRYRILFAIQPTLVILSLLLLARVKEPKAAELTSFNGAFRTMRQILVNNGFLLMGNLTFFKIFRKGIISTQDKNKAGGTHSSGLSG